MGETESYSDGWGHDGIADALGRAAETDGVGEKLYPISVLKASPFTLSISLSVCPMPGALVS